MATSNYQQDLRNLFPWVIDSVGSDKNYDGRTVTLSFYFQNTENKYIDLMFLSSSTVVVIKEGHAGMRIYHPTNSKTLDKLVEYLQTHGIMQ